MSTVNLNEAAAVFAMSAEKVRRTYYMKNVQVYTI
jgi:hypothetical protein